MWWVFNKKSLSIVIRIEHLFKWKNYMEKTFEGIASEFSRPLVHLVFNGTETTSVLGSKLWDLVSHEIKQKEPVAAFPNSIMAWNPRNCPSRSSGKCLQQWIYLNYDFLRLTNFNKKFI